MTALELLVPLCISVVAYEAISRTDNKFTEALALLTTLFFAALCFVALANGGTL